MNNLKRVLTLEESCAPPEVSAPVAPVLGYYSAIQGASKENKDVNNNLPTPDLSQRNVPSFVSVAWGYKLKKDPFTAD